MSELTVDQPPRDVMREHARRLQRAVGKHAHARDLRALAELTASIAIVAAGYAIAIGQWEESKATAMLAVPVIAVGLVRVFVVQHDCGHHAFFSSARANAWAGRICSGLTLFPFGQWRNNHAIHHASVGNLERRGAGDIRTITRSEYHQLSWREKLAYRLYRNPVVLMGIGGAFYTLIRNRMPRRAAGSKRRENLLSCLSMNAYVAGLAAGAWATGGLEFFALVSLPSVALGGSIGIAFFFAGHQFERTYWADGDDWDLTTAALYGSSHLSLPEPLGWLSGYVGTHHVHHLNSRIPFYNFRACLRDSEELSTWNSVSAASAARATRLAVWDESRSQLASVD